MNVNLYPNAYSMYRSSVKIRYDTHINFNNAINKTSIVKTVIEYTEYILPFKYLCDNNMKSERCHTIVLCCASKYI